MNNHNDQEPFDSSSENASPDAALEERVVALVRSDGYRPTKPRVIARVLGLTSDEDKRRLRRTIKRLVKVGVLEFGPKHIVFPGTGKRRVEELIGVFRRTRRGDGWVVPRRAATGEKPPDVHIPRRDTLDASTGDTVRVHLRRARGAGGRRRGIVVEILERATHRFVGVYHEPHGEGLVTVDGRIFAHPIPVADAGAKNVRPGDKVVIELIHFPTHYDPGEGVVVEVLGPRGQPGIDTLSVMREYDLPESFPQDVLDAARRAAEAFQEEVPADRRDFTDWTTVTIDPVDARDFDDAVSLDRLPDGTWRLGVHIADVAHFVPAGSVVDREAQQRGTSVYLPDRVIPMLPETLSNAAASLQPGRIRFTRTVLIEFDPNGRVRHAETVRSAIRSDRRFTYEEVDDYLEDPARWQDRLEPDVHRLLGDMHALAMMLRQRRLTSGAIELDLPEIKIELDEGGKVCGAHRVEHTESHQIIEEFMIAANVAVATLLDDHEAAFLHRIHPAPDRRKLETLTDFIQQLGYECESLESRFEIKRVIEAARGKPEAFAVNLAVLKSMQKAVYSPEAIGHYALNETHYCHFTSPIRRYPDLTVHRLLDRLERGKPLSSDKRRWFRLAEHCSAREQRAEDAERDLIKIKLLALLSDRIGSTMPAIITGVEEFGLFVQGVELPVEGLVHISTLDDDYYDYEERSHALVGRRQDRTYRLGDAVEVEVVRLNIDQREIDFRIVRRLGRSSTAGEARSERRPPDGRKGRNGTKGRARIGGRGRGGGRASRKGRRRR